MSQAASTAGIVTDENSGQRHIPESVRADGTTRKAIKIRPGYRPPEDVEIYKNRTAENFKNLGKGGIPGSESLSSDKEPLATSSASSKNAKRREARKKAKSSTEDQSKGEVIPQTTDAPETKQEERITEVDKEKKARNLKKKLKQAMELQGKKKSGESLLPEQIAKVIKINELIRELEALGRSDNVKPATEEDGSATAAKDIQEG